MSDRDVNKGLVEEFLKAFSSGNVGQALSYLDDTATWWVPGQLTGISGTRTKVEFGQAYEGAASAMKGPIQLIPTAWTIDGDRLAVEMVSHAELKDGRKYDNVYHTVFEVGDGKIKSVREYSDTDLIRSTFFS
jgi:ketosteroid isomerase-like protein